MSVEVEREQAFLAEVRQIAEDVAGPCSDAVDREARFPAEAIDALRERGALSAFVATESGGAGVSISAIGQACAALGRRCGATAMVYAMHQIQVASIQRHYAGSAWFAAYLETLARDQRVIASATSEIGTGGDMSRSVAAVTDNGDGTAGLEKQAPVISYGAYADDLLTTVRRAPDAAESDQVMVLTMRDQMTLEPMGTWDSLGMRGTCSAGAVVRATFDVAQVLAAPFSTIAAETMVPVAHLLWSHVWLGIAEDAFDRARACSRSSARRSPNDPSTSDQRISHVLRDLTLLRAEVSDGLAHFIDADGVDREALMTVGAALTFNNLKIASSEMAEQVCRGALMVCGMQGYKNDTAYSVGRHLRDSLSASLMVANNRVHATNARLLLVAKGA